MQWAGFLGKTLLTWRFKRATNGSLIMDLSPVIDFLEKGEHIGLLLPQTPGIDVLAAAEVIARTLAKRKKTVGLFYDIEFPPRGLPDIFGALRSTKKLPKEFVISLDTALSPASELRYEKTDSRIDVIFSPKDSGILQEHVSFREGKVQCDCIVSLGIPDIESVSGAITDDPEIFTRTPIIAIDSSPENKRFGEVNIADARPHSEVVYSLVTAMEKLPPEEHEATILLAGILAATRHLTSPGLLPETILAVSELMRAGADYKEALALSKEKRPLNIIQLTGRAHVRSKLDPDEKILWSFLTGEDFEKTNSGIEDANRVLAAISRECPWETVAVLLAQDPGTERIFAFLTGDDRALSEIGDSAGGEWKDSSLSLPSSFEHFADAEDYVRSLLGRAL